MKAPRLIAVPRRSGVGRVSPGAGGLAEVMRAVVGGPPVAPPPLSSDLVASVPGVVAPLDCNGVTEPDVAVRAPNTGIMRPGELVNAKSTDVTTPLTTPLTQQLDDPDVIKRALRARLPDAEVINSLACAVQSQEKWAIELWLGYIFGRPVERSRLDILQESRTMINWLVELRTTAAPTPAPTVPAATEGEYTEVQP